MKRLCVMMLSVLIMTAAVMCGAGLAEELSDPTKPIEVAAGTEFTVILESNKTTGYGWELADPLDDQVLKFVSSEYIPDKTGLVGSGGRELWTFKALGQGQAQIALNYVRSWEKGAAAAREAVFTVIVK